MSRPNQARLRFWYGAIFLVASVLAYGKANAQWARLPFEQGTHTLRHILNRLELKSLSSFQYLNPERTILLVLGDVGPLDDLPGGARQFVEQGGALLVATDRTVLRGPLRDDFGLAIVGIDSQVLVYAGPDAHQYYRGQFYDCPIVIPDARFGPPDFPALPPANLEGVRPSVFTNRPGTVHTAGAEADGIQVLARLPRECKIRGDFSQPLGQDYPFAVGGKLGRGRLLVLADHSVFINAMMLQDDTANIEFANSILEWLKDNQRTTVLLFEDGFLQDDFRIPLRDLPAPSIPPPQVLVPWANELLAGWQEEDLFNRLLAENIDAWRFIRWTAVLLAISLTAYGFYRFGQARHRIEPGVPLLERTLARLAPEGPGLVLRHQMMLQTGNLWETARTLARQCLEPALQQAPRGAAGRQAGGPPPRLAIEGSWWQRRSLRRKTLRLWQLARGPNPVPFSSGQLARLLDDVADVEAALEDGTLRFVETG